MGVNPSQAKTESITPNAKPFLKWAGDKGQFLPQLEELLPVGLEDREFA
jgi:hypothetical protein